MRSALTTLALALCACGPGPILLLDVAAPMDTQRLNIYGVVGETEVAFEQRKAHALLEVDGAPERVTLELPKGIGSPVKISVHAVGGADRCVVAMGSNETPVKLDAGAGPYQAQVKLVSFAAHRCDGGGARLRALSVLPGPIVYAVGEQGRVLRWDPQKGAIVVTVSGLPEPPPTLNGVFAASDTAVWAVGDDGVILKGGADGFSRESAAGITTERLYGVHGENAQDVWAVGEKGVLLHRQATWSKEPTNVTQDLRAVRARDSRVVAVGSGGLVLNRDMGAFKTISSMGADLQAISAVGGAKFWISGAAGRVLLYQVGQAPRPVGQGDAGAQTGVWASDSGDVVTVSDAGNVQQCSADMGCKNTIDFEGVSDRAASFAAIAGAQSPKDLWLAGAFGASDLLWHVVLP